MDFGGVVGGFDGLMGGSSEGGGGGFLSSPLVSSDPELSRQRGLFGSGHLKHGRSGGPDEKEWRCPKFARSEPLLRSNSHSLFIDGEQMVSFSSPRTDAMLISSDEALPYYYHASSSTSSSSSTPAYLRNQVSGLGSGLSNANMHGVFAGVRGPFTPSQWMELEHQALIYKYIDANVPIPSSLLIPIRRSLVASGSSTFFGGSFRSNTLGWGSFQLGFSGSSDPEPGRCRRTDGKKWRCSRDAVAEQKYCERHMNRGRHRSRKHVEGHAGHAAKAMPIIVPPQSASAVSSGRSSNCLTAAQQQSKSLQPHVTDTSPAQFNRMLMSQENAEEARVQDTHGLPMLTSIKSKSGNTLFPTSKQHNPFEGSSSRSDFGLISTNSFPNLPRSSYTDSISFDRQSQSHPLRHFIDDWPKDQSNSSTITWPEVDEMQSDRIQLSISIPMASSDFSSSTSSPHQEKLTLSPLRLSREFDPIPMGLGVGGVLNEVSQRQASWVPISWESSLGGPLGEVLANTSSTPKDHGKNCPSSSLNLLTDGWNSSPRLQSSPTDVLQKTTFGSLSSSTGSSPRAENCKAHDSTSRLCEDLLGPTLVNSSTIPLLWASNCERNQ